MQRVMKIKGFGQLYDEEDTWLNRGRKQLVMGILDREVRGAGNDMLDVGAGSGFYVPLLAAHGAVDAVEVCEPALGPLRQREGLRDLYVESMPFPLEKRYDYIQCLDVLGAIDGDEAAAAWLISLLKPGGTLLVTVPAYQWLFSYHDVAVNHVRRYSRASLVDLIPPDFSIIQSGYFNTALFPLAVATRVIGAVTRWFKRTSDGDEKQSSRLPRFVDRLFGIILTTEAFRIMAGHQPAFGLTAFCVVRRPQPSRYDVCDRSA